MVQSFDLDYTNCLPVFQPFFTVFADFWRKCSLPLCNAASPRVNKLCLKIVSETTFKRFEKTKEYARPADKIKVPSDSGAALR